MASVSRFRSVGGYEHFLGSLCISIRYTVFSQSSKYVAKSHCGFDYRFAFLWRLMEWSTYYYYFFCLLVIWTGYSFFCSTWSRLLPIFLLGCQSFFFFFNWLVRVLFKLVLATWDPLHFRIDSKISISISANEMVRILIRTALNL